MKVNGLVASGVCVLLALGSCLKAQADTNSIYSMNTYGFRKVQIPSNNYTLVGFPFTALPSDINTVIGPQLTGGGHELQADTLLMWDASAQRYHAFYLLNDIGDTNYNYKWIDTWLQPQDVATSSIPAGTGFWINSRQEDAQQLVLIGEVLSSSTYTNHILPGLQMISYPYSTAIELNKTTLSSGATPGMSIENADTIITWDPDAHRFNYYYFLADVGDTNYNYKWIDTGRVPYADVATNFLRTGQAFWYRHFGTNAFEWIEPKPY